MKVPFIIMARVAPKRNVFLDKRFADPTIKMSAFYPNSNIS